MLFLPVAMQPGFLFEAIMNICIITNSHPSNDIRLYYKIAKSAAHIGDTYVLSTNGISNLEVNPYQIVVSGESKWLALYQLFQKARLLNPGIVICVEPLTLFVGLALRRACKTRLVFDVHEFFAEAFAERVSSIFSYPAYMAYLLVERWLARRMDYTFAVNDLILKQLYHGSNRKNTLVLPNYPVKNVWENQTEVPVAIHPICAMNFDLIYIGGLTIDRGLVKMLKSVSILKREFPAIKVLFVGMFHSTDVEKRFLQDLNTYNLNAIIYYQSWLPAEKIGLLLNRARIGLWLFNPKNRRMCNALPLKVMEYLAAGLPIVTIKTPLMNSIVKVNQVGICTEYHATPIAEAIASLLRISDDDYAGMKQRCLKLAEERFNWEALEPKLINALCSLYPSERQKSTKQ